MRSYKASFDNSPVVGLGTLWDGPGEQADKGKGGDEDDPLQEELEPGHAATSTPRLLRTGY